MYGVAIEGDVIAHHVARPEPLSHSVYIHERATSSWTTQRVELEGEDWRTGDLTAVSGDTVATLAADSWNHPIEVHFVERDASGTWSVSDVVETNLLSPWFDYGMHVDLEGDLAVVG